MRVIVQKSSLPYRGLKAKHRPRRTGNCPADPIDHQFTFAGLLLVIGTNAGMIAGSLLKEVGFAGRRL
jgi:hypothetical protein